MAQCFGAVTSIKLSIWSVLSENYQAVTLDNLKSLNFYSIIIYCINLSIFYFFLLFKWCLFSLATTTCSYLSRLSGHLHLQQAVIVVIFVAYFYFVFLELFACYQFWLDTPASAFLFPYLGSYLHLLRISVLYFLDFLCGISFAWPPLLAPYFSPILACLVTYGGL